MSELLIKNAVVCDPINNINCENMDISVKDGKIVKLDVKPVHLGEAETVSVTLAVLPTE